MTEGGNMTEAKERWGVLVKVSLPEQPDLWRWSSGIDNVPYEFEQSQCAESVAKLAYDNNPAEYRVYKIRDHFGEFLNESRYVRNDGKLY